MASTGHGQRDPQWSSNLLARVGVFVGLFGIGLSTLLATVAVQEQLGPLWFTLLLTLGIALVLGGGAGSIYSLVAARRRSAAVKSSWRVFRGSWTYLRATAIAAGVLTSVILAVSLLFIVFRTETPLITATSTALTMSPASSVIEGTEVALTAAVTPAEAAGTVQFKDGTTDIGTPVLVTKGTASGTTSTLAVGSHQLTAVFTPTDPAVYGPSTSPPVTFVVTGR
jgi:hypothetical protein